MRRVVEQEISLEIWKPVFTPRVIREIIEFAKRYGKYSPFTLVALATEAPLDEKTYGLYVLRINDAAASAFHTGDPDETLLCLTRDPRTNRPESLPSILIFLASDSDHSDHLALRCKMTRDTRVRNSRWTLQKLEASGEWVGDTVIGDPLG